MTSEMVDNTLAEAESEGDAVAKATERCLRAEGQFGSGEIGLIDLYKIYHEICQDSIPADADVDYGPWSHIFWRRRRLLRLVNEKHLRKSWRWSDGEFAWGNLWKYGDETLFENDYIDDLIVKADNGASVSRELQRAKHRAEKKMREVVNARRRMGWVESQ